MIRGTQVRSPWRFGGRASIAVGLNFSHRIMALMAPQVNNVSGLRVKQKFMWRQWQKANNYIRSVQAFQDMSPDLSVRNQVNQSLCRHRRPLSLEAWCEEFHREIPAFKGHTLLFIYHRLEAYSGIEFNLVRPHDRLVDDLRFPLVCWFDWSTRFCDDVAAEFSIDIGSCFDETRIHTTMDLVIFLEGCLSNSSKGKTP